MERYYWYVLYCVGSVKEFYIAGAIENNSKVFNHDSAMKQYKTMYDSASLNQDKICNYKQMNRKEFESFTPRGNDFKVSIDLDPNGVLNFLLKEYEINSESITVLRPHVSIITTNDSKLTRNIEEWLSTSPDVINYVDNKYYHVESKLHIIDTHDVDIFALSVMETLEIRQQLQRDVFKLEKKYDHVVKKFEESVSALKKFNKFIEGWGDDN